MSVRVRNLTPLPHHVLVWADGAGRCWGSIIVKATCRLADGSLLSEQAPLLLSDRLASSGAVRAPADVVPRRTGTSVIVHGAICAPREAVATRVDASIKVGPLEKRITGWGSRSWVAQGERYVPGPPGPFRAIPLTLQYAFGGTCGSNAISTNPIGTGFISPDEDVVGRPLPNLEDAAAPIRSVSDRPHPASLDATPATFTPRLERAGTYDDMWREHRAPFPPDDFDDRFFDVAQEGLVARPGLRGGEMIAIDGMTADGRLDASIPRLPLRIDGGGRRELPSIDLVVIDVPARTISVTLRRTFDLAYAELVPVSVTILFLRSARNGVARVQ